MEQHTPQTIQTLVQLEAKMSTLPVAHDAIQQGIMDIVDSERARIGLSWEEVTERDIPLSDAAISRLHDLLDEHSEEMDVDAA